MTPVLAKAIVEMLARGVAPFSGELLAEDGPLSHPQVICALFMAAKAFEGLTDKPPRVAKTQPSQAGRPWTSDEDQRLLAAFDEGLAVAALAGEHERTNGAIRSRLIRLGRLEGSKPAA